MSATESTAPLWGAAAHDWATIQEPTCQAVYLAAFDRLSLAPGTRLLDVGCGAGLAAQIAADAKAIRHAGQAAVDHAHTQALQPFQQPDGSVRIPATFRCLLGRP